MQESSVSDLSAGTDAAGHYGIAYGGFIILLVLVAIVTPFATEAPLTSCFRQKA